MPGGKGTSCRIKRAITPAKRHASNGCRQKRPQSAGPCYDQQRQGQQFRHNVRQRPVTCAAAKNKRRRQGGAAQQQSRLKHAA